MSDQGQEPLEMEMVREASGEKIDFYLSHYSSISEDRVAPGWPAGSL